MTIYLAFAGLLLLVPITGILPIVIEGRHNRNYIWGVTMIPPSGENYAVQSYVAIYAQEIVEWYVKWLVALILAAPAAWVLRDMPNAPVLQIGAALVATLWVRPKPMQRQFELLGHAVEVETARRMRLREDYPRVVARWLQVGYGKAFKSWTVERIEDALEARRGLARFFLTLLALGVRRGARDA